MTRRMMPAFLVLSCVSALAAPQLYDGFDYTVGEMLDGKTNAVYNLTWAASTGSGTRLTINTAQLSYPGLADATGHSVHVPQNSSGRVNRIGVGGAYTSGTLYYSLLMRVSDVASLPANNTGIFIAGFNNSAPECGGAVTQAVVRLNLRKSLTDAAKFQIGTRTNQATPCTTQNPPVTVNDVQWYPTELVPSEDVYFIVGRYTLNPNTAFDDEAAMWINPPLGTFGADTAPAPTLTHTGCDGGRAADCAGNAANQDPSPVVQNFFLRTIISSTASAGIIVDEVRIGETWADVTPPSGTPPLGGCCVPGGFGTGTCSVTSQENCENTLGGTYLGDHVGCGFQNANCGSFCPAIYGDTDGDGDVDQADYGRFQECFSGSGLYGPGCACFDRNNDLVINGTDYLTFSNCASGPHIPASETCDD
ncbi:MAG: hypothetical protein HRF43_03095 [Phycisphaerae bacterium]